MIDKEFWERIDAQLLAEEQMLGEMKEYLGFLDEVEAEDVLEGWYRDVAHVED